MRRITVLISNLGTGTNLQALIDEATTGYNGQIVCVISSKADAYGLVRAKQADIPTEIFDYTDFRAQGKPRARYEEELAQTLQRYSPDLIVLAGWKLALSQTFLRYFPWRVIALHPGLIPDRPGNQVKLPDGTYGDDYAGLAGENAIQALLAAGQTYAGSTVYVVTDQVDRGPVLARGLVKVEPGDDVETLYERLKEKEHDILLDSLHELCLEKAKSTR